MTDLVQSAANLDDGNARSRIGLRFELVELSFVFADVLAILASSIAGGGLYHLAIGGAFDIATHAGLGVLATLTYGLAAHRIGLYRLNQLLVGQNDTGRVWVSWSLAILLLAVVLFLLKSGAEISRGSVVCLFLLGGLGLTVARRAAKARMRVALMAGAIHGRRAVMIGTHRELAQFTRRDLLVRFGLDEVERIVLPRDSSWPALEPQMADADMVLQRVRQAPVEEIVLAVPWSQLPEFETLLDRLRVVPLRVRLLPDHAVSAILRRQGAAPHGSYAIEMQRTPLNGLERWAKRLLDLTVAATSLVFLVPLLVISAAAIRLETAGPVIFRQRRHGFNGKSFIIYKLRTMTVTEEGAAVVQALKEDPRVTRVGRVLRATSIDELPQLWNVLRGDMSIVGPRPHALVHDYEYSKMIANYAYRHHVKPGITGWAQVHGFRGGTPQLELMQRRIQLDLWYIDNWSLMLDIHIIVKTAFELLRRRNAY
jgi:undecaprenyl-phosphate galactose phosphotransferase/putative colanic acid biosynthesis UDP-glucose lipid carrier transferase